MALDLDPDQLLALLKDRTRRELPATGLRQSAVLVPIFRRDGEWHLLLTRRSDLVGSHKGQISFPGGRQEPGDSSLLMTALREAEEEVGLKPEDVRVLGALDDTVTLATDRITPFLGVIPQPYPFRFDPAEVAYLLDVPVRSFLEPERLRIEAFARPDGSTRDVYFYTFESPSRTDVVWGATARIITEWLALLGHPLGVDKPGTRA
jgi:8-oxo-dGTP pyrophosphatase MutT (NUDIX family)